MNKERLFYFVLLFFYTPPAQSLIIGSTTVPSRQAAAVFPTGQSNNTMLGFAVFENGFVLTDQLTTCSFNDYFSISGVVNMRGGILNLAQEITCGEATVFASTGTINGGSLSMSLPPAINAEIVLPKNTPINYLNHISETNTSVLSNDWSFDNTYIGFGAVTGAANPLGVIQFNPVTFALTTVASVNPGAFNVNSVRFHPSLYYLAVALNTTVNSLATYLFTPPSTFTAQGSANPAHVATAVAWSPNGNFLAAGFSDGIRVYSFNSGTGALTLVASDLPGHQVSNNAISWSGDGLYIVAGYVTAVAFNELRVDLFNGASLTNVASFNFGATVLAASWNPTADYIGVGLANTITQTLRMFKFTRTTNTLSEVTTARVGQTNNLNTIAWLSDGGSIAVGLSNPAVNTINTYNFNQLYGLLNLTSTTGLANGAGIDDIRWSPNNVYFTTADQASTFVSVYLASTPLVLQNISLYFNADVNLQSQTIFQGQCLIDGNNFALDLTNMPGLTIGSGASLTLKNMLIKGISGSNINCTDTTGVLTLENVTWIQTGTFTFSNGALVIATGETLITGTSAFIYSSSKTSTISSQATLMFDNLMTFSYAPSNSSNTLIQFTDVSSSLYLLNNTLYCGTSGLLLTKGTVYVDGPCNVFSSATSNAQAIKFGDGLSSSNNINLQVLAESGFNLQTGYLLFQNV